MEHVKTMNSCEGCGAPLSSAKFMFEKENVRGNSPLGPFRLLRCSFCDLVFVSNPPPLEHLRKIYRDAYYSTAQHSDSSKGASAARKNSIKRVLRIQPYCNHGKLLDIGSGTGIFLDVAQKLFDITGVELSAYGVQYAHREFGLNLIHGDFEQVANMLLRKRWFDVITLWDVIGHFPKPRHYLYLVNSLLKPGGIVVMTTGDIDSFIARLLKHNWHLATPPEILFFFSKKSIRLLLESIGFEILKIERPGKYVSLDFMADKFCRLYGWSWPKKLMHMAPWRELYINFFDIMTIYARRPMEAQ